MKMEPSNAGSLGYVGFVSYGNALGLLNMFSYIIVR